jgi:ADP-ribose pyrophosphatase YjhB (NUDIX family)
MALKLRHRLLQRGLLAYGRLSRGMTLGVRAMLLQGDSILLVKHSYVPGWYFPGGGVEAGEGMAEALGREIREEAGAALTGPPQLFGIYRNANADSRDHVALYVCRHWQRVAGFKVPNREIVAAELFPLDRLPADATPATLVRIGEVLRGEPPSADW